MGCATSHLLNHDDQDFTKIGSSALSHHIVSLTSTTYGLLTLDPLSSKPKTTISIFPEPPSEPKTEPQPEVINSWELMAGLDSTNESFRLCIQPTELLQENSNPDHKNPTFLKPPTPKTFSLNQFENLCPPNGENRVVLYTTSLRGVRTTFEACNTVRSLMEGFGVFVCERDISMDLGFREELRELMKGKDSKELVPPRVFVKGRYVGGVDAVVKMMEDGNLGKLIEGLPKLKSGYVCEGCGGVRFLPCFKCNGSCKMVVDRKEDGGGGLRRRRVVVRCGDCNENGLVHCPICS